MPDTSPIIEFDPAREALVNPDPPLPPADFPTRGVLCFFHEILSVQESEGRLRRIASQTWEDGEHVWYAIDHHGQQLAVAHPGLGAPLAGAVLEHTIAYGCRRIIACGGSGVLEGDLEVGQIILPTSAVRDEGTSYHYLAPGVQAEPHPRALQALRRTLEARSLPYRMGPTWTTDGLYRETPKRIARRRAAGCLTVEMEAAAFFAIARYRGAELAQIVYAGDDVSGLKWDRRGWQLRSEVRSQLLMIALDACLLL